MKRIIQAVVAAALLTGTQAKADSDPLFLLSQWTYADQHAAEIAREPMVSAFPGTIPDPNLLVSQSTHADRHAAEIAREPVVSAFPGTIPDPNLLVSRSTYADQFASERNVQASAATDPALSQ